MQDAIVYLIVAAAVVYLARGVWQTSRGKKGCGSCGTGCGVKKAPPPAAGGLIQISLNGTSANITKPGVPRPGHEGRAP